MFTESVSSDLSSNHPFARTIGSNSSRPAWPQSMASFPGEMAVFDAPSYRNSDRGFERPTEHKSTLSTTGNQPWMTVKIRSSASSPTSMPSFVEGQSISGQVELDLRAPNKIKAIVVSINGYCIIPGYQSRTFLHISETLWESSMGDPRSESIFLSQGTLYAGKLYGQYVWHFTIDLPKSIALDNSLGVKHNERLPPTLRGSYDRARIGYEVVVKINRPGLRCGNKLTIPIAYTSSTKSGPLSLIRQLAYQDNTPMPCFDSDPSGWKVFPEVEMHGLFYRRQITFHCSLALAFPLEYARGLNIPCALLVTSSNPQILELMSSYSVLRVYLKRELVLRSRLGGEIDLDGEEKQISKASWKPLHDSFQSRQSNEKIVQGEIDVSPMITPSFKFGRLELKGSSPNAAYSTRYTYVPIVQYFVDLLPFDALGFTPSSEERLLRVEVTIASLPAEGPHPRSYLSPA